MVGKGKKAPPQGSQGPSRKNHEWQKRLVDLDNRVHGAFESLKEVVTNFQNDIVSEFNALNRNVTGQIDIIFKNERSIADQVYTVSVRQAVLMKWLNAEGGMSNEWFNERIEEEIARRKLLDRQIMEAQKKAAEQAAAEAKVQELKAATPAAPEKAPETEEEVWVFGGDFGQEVEGAGGEDGAVPDSGADPGAGRAGNGQEGPVGEAGSDPGEVLREAGAGAEDGSPDPSGESFAEDLPDDGGS